jgi:hypothetical protein
MSIKKLKEMKHSIVFIPIIGIALGIVGFILSYFVQNNTTVALIQHLSSCSIEISIAIIIVNIYLERKSKQDAIYSILQYSDTNIIQFHNKLLDFMWTKFGKNEWGDLIAEYVDGDSEPEVILPERRNNIYEIIETNYNALSLNIRNLESTLIEMTYLIGWNLDADLLKLSIDARTSINKFFQVTIDDSSESRLQAIKHLIDIDCFTTEIRRTLIKLANVKEEGE